MSFLNTFFGRAGLQYFFSKLYWLALKGLNYGRASDYEGNGEAFALRKVAAAVMTAEPVLFDVGANVGHYTEELANAFGDRQFKLMAFEPSEKVFQLLKGKVGSKRGVALFNFGMSDKTSTAVLHSREGASGLSSLYQRDLTHRDIVLDREEAIQLSSLDEFCRENKITKIDFLKMDVEGHEMAVLRGASQLLAANQISIIQFEFGGCNIDSRTYFRDFYQLLSPNFTLYRILRNGFSKIESYDERLEVFYSANYLAVNKQLVF